MGLQGKVPDNFMRLKFSDNLRSYQLSGVGIESCEQLVSYNREVSDHLDTCTIHVEMHHVFDVTSLYVVPCARQSNASISVA